MDSREKILVVEDDISSQQYYRFIFRDRFEIRMVSSIMEAKQALEKESFGVALIDLSLPGGESGLELIRFLRKNYPDGKPVPIAVTAHVFPQNQIEAMEAGAKEFLTKPILSKVLLDVIMKYVDS